MGRGGGGRGVQPAQQPPYGLEGEAASSAATWVGGYGGALGFWPCMLESYPTCLTAYSRGGHGGSWGVTNGTTRHASQHTAGGGHGGSWGVTNGTTRHASQHTAGGGDGGEGGVTNGTTRHASQHTAGGGDGGEGGVTNGTTRHAVQLIGGGSWGGREDEGGRTWAVRRMVTS